MKSGGRKALPAKEREALLGTLKARFEANPDRHRGIAWEQVVKRLEANPAKLWSLSELEKTGGEPDVIGRDAKTGEVTFCDCAAETPKGRRSVCYDDEALEARKENKPKASALGLAEAMGVELLDEAGYRGLQALGPFDQKTSSWLLTPPEVRELGGALFGDFRYGRVFTYHNGAESYYAARSFRGVLRV
ncbi:MAG: DUF4256 domain-containing protein [Myxococcaceae bacterium]|nr:DUF4256 domain-containing protein [Myxococcaceae bacterium]